MRRCTKRQYLQYIPSGQTDGACPQGRGTGIQDRQTTLVLISQNTTITTVFMGLLTTCMSTHKTLEAVVEDSPVWLSTDVEVRQSSCGILSSGWRNAARNKICGRNLVQGDRIKSRTEWLHTWPRTAHCQDCDFGQYTGHP